MAGVLLPQTAALADSKDSKQLRSSFPGRRIGGGTRGECTSRLLVHLVPVTSVYAPGGASLLGVLEGPALEPMPLEVRFRPYREVAALGQPGQARRRNLPAAPAGITLLQAASSGGPTVWESQYRCSQEARGEDPLGFSRTTAPPVVSLLLGGEEAVAEDRRVRTGLQRLRQRCGAQVPRSEVAEVFGLADLLTRGWPEQLPVRCP